MNEQSKPEKCKCPYCDVEIEETTVFCITCDSVIIDCVHCGEPVRDDADLCPHCGEPPK